MDDLPTLFLLPFLAATGRQWDGVASRLAGLVRPVPLDLPGFGAARADRRFTVAGMAEAVAEAVRARAPRRWAVAGHSMGGKVALALARMAEDGAPGLGGLERIALVAPSPPGPEPMDEAQRAAMTGWFAGDAAARLRQARDYLRANAAAPLDPGVLERAAADVAGLERDAWAAWLGSGSREDWAARVGMLRTPALVLAGAEDPALGPEPQRRLTMPHLARGRLEAIGGAGHLLPLERPDEAARHIGAHLADGDAARGSP